MKNEIMDIIEEFVGITGEKISSRHNLRKTGLNEAADEIIKTFQGKEKPGYPFEKVRKFLVFVIDKVFINDLGVEVIVPAGDVLFYAQDLLKEINAAGLPDQMRLP